MRVDRCECLTGDVGDGLLERLDLGCLKRLQSVDRWWWIVRRFRRRCLQNFGSRHGLHLREISAAAVLVAGLR
ncbi:hypothetical protein RchiOBHm_Chr2g0116051 [Rosa chinensis]|uniref:Uncharacterized protein n=1 Tax=Rosa chinensis TaxID=74649 RepID=A0A2P6RR55_ROSCH|nr:hypothetical protein RchiOBHm_Chr2g0116051 [Rosa chinensis]